MVTVTLAQVTGHSEYSLHIESRTDENCIRAEQSNGNFVVMHIKCIVQESQIFSSVKKIPSFSLVLMYMLFSSQFIIMASYCCLSHRFSSQKAKR